MKPLRKPSPTANQILVPSCEHTFSFHIRFPEGFAHRFSHVGIGAGRCCWSAGFLGDLPLPPSLHYGIAPYSHRFTLIGSQDLDIKSLPNLSTPLSGAIFADSTKKVSGRIKPIFALRKYRALSPPLLGGIQSSFQVFEAVERLNSVAKCVKYTFLQRAELRKEHTLETKVRYVTHVRKTIPKHSSIAKNCFYEALFLEIYASARGPGVGSSVLLAVACCGISPIGWAAGWQASYHDADWRMTFRDNAACQNRIRLERASQKHSSDAHKIPYDRVKRCRERKINIKASERVNVDVFKTNGRFPNTAKTNFWLITVQSSSTCQQNGVTIEQLVGAPFANQRVVTYLQAGSTGNWEPYAACKSQSGAKPVPRYTRAANQRMSSLLPITPPPPNFAKEPPHLLVYRKDGHGLKKSEDPQDRKLYTFRPSDLSDSKIKIIDNVAKSWKLFPHGRDNFSPQNTEGIAVFFNKYRRRLKVEGCCPRLGDSRRYDRRPNAIECSLSQAVEFEGGELFCPDRDSSPMRIPFGRPPVRPPPEQIRDRDSHESALATRRRRAHIQLTKLSAGPSWHSTSHLSSVHVPPITMFYSPPNALTHSRLHSSVSHPSAIHAMNTSLAVVLHSPVVVHNLFRSRTLDQAASVKTADRWVAAVYIRGPDASKTPSSATARQVAVHYSLVSQKGDLGGRESIVPGRWAVKVGLLPWHGAADSAPVAERNTASSLSLFVPNILKTFVRHQSVDVDNLRLRQRALSANPVDHIIYLLQGPVWAFPRFL
ncbi:hypothetical protein PR048_019003 [Dryococelus australis]|uniref:Uncharacterized protein n=1 Tax=Dryococelus australis TaxID=614101 RepID=A0ABQ9H2D3_9NEOP|nr:hypothetical protein PR048_019003 [Dryococelus australis]